MRFVCLLLLSCIFSHAATTNTPAIRIQSGQYLYAGSASFTAGTTNVAVGSITNLDGYYCESNIVGLMRWQFDKNIIANTNAISTFNILTTNSTAGIHGSGFQLSLNFYTNGASLTTLTPLYTTNVPLAAAVLTLPGNGTNIYSVSFTNALPTSILSNNVAFGTISLIKINVAGAIGGLYVLNGKITFP